MHRALADSPRSCFMLLFSRLHHVHAVFATTGSQSEGPTQCISYNSHTLLIHLLKFMSFQRDPLRQPWLPLSQEGHGDSRARGQMPNDSLRCTSTCKSHINADIMDINRNHQLSLSFFPLSTTAIVNLWSECVEK